MKYIMRQEYIDQPDLFHGASIDVDHSTLPADLLQIPGVKVRSRFMSIHSAGG